jgi:hypothetical protein
MAALGGELKAPGRRECTICGDDAAQIVTNVLGLHEPRCARHGPEKQHESLVGVKPDSVLGKAHAITEGPRCEAYGLPEENHARTAAMWGDYLGVKITAHDVCMLNILQKVSRQRHRASTDNLVDIAGYAANAERCTT